ncbi:hypothetical protein ACS127_02610 [Amphibacillus sp. Q70]|uniref:hypothetical protein n=1 Tax=Amphibacillus sp. Q70 TaxID=3453416 RepID=UPI003F8588F4
MKNNQSFIFVVILVVFLFVGVYLFGDKQDSSLVYDQVIEELERTNQELEEKTVRQREELANRDAEILNYKETIGQLVSQLNDNQLMTIAEDHWQYQLTVNDINIPKDGIVEIDNHFVEFVLVEHQSENVFLPDELLAQGQISGEFLDEHLFGISSGLDGEGWTEIGRGIDRDYFFGMSGLESGAEVQLSITDELKERLALDTNRLIIRRK